MLRNLSEKLGANWLQSSICGYSKVTFAFSELLELEASPVEGQLLQQKDTKRRKKKGSHISQADQ